mgnify:CR=1 FL=1
MVLSIHPWMNDANDGCVAVGEGITEKVSEFLVMYSRNQTHEPHTLCEEEPSQATWLTVGVLAAQTLAHLTSI